MSRVAIVGSCITRDVWPIVGEAPPQDLLYISRTSFPSLFARPLQGVELADELPDELTPFPHRAMVADLGKTALGALLAHRPTHIIFDFIDERLDLLATGETVVTHSWELDVSGYLAQAPFATARAIRRTSRASDLLWSQAAREMAAFIRATPLHQAKIIVHEARWADRYLDADGQPRPFAEDVEIFTGKPARIADYNAVLDRYQAQFRELFPQADRVAAPEALRIGDAGHRWGLSPFHYVEDYYREVWRQFQAVGI